MLHFNLIFTVLTLTTSTAFADTNAEWFSKVPNHLKFRSYFGSRGTLKGCIVEISPSDKSGIKVTINRASRFNLLGSRNDALASFEIYPTDTLVGSSEHRTGPFEDTKEGQKVLAFGYFDKTLKSNTSLVIEQTKDDSVALTIESENGKSTTCTVNPEDKE